ncbi:type II toxin-antitoxin system RelE/ParE family toxin [Telmatobacter bradus]|uniref:type II toxin-antitoxin system RelE/ParE family toxin n=1 Tax=Telmatobacter bradus TaxID=474953 RepID=UPI003B433454
MGRTCEWISPGLRRHESGSHVIFYRLRPSGIRITRVLHQQMLPEDEDFVGWPARLASGSFCFLNDFRSFQ